MAAPIDSRPAADATLHRIDVATFVRLGELGVYPARSMLVDGIVYSASPKGDPHFLAQSEIIEQLVLAGRGRYRVGAEPTLKVDEHDGPMPGVLVTPRNAPISSLSAVLTVEIADTSLACDRTGKRALYSAAREYWVVDYSTSSSNVICPRRPIRPRSSDRTKRLRRRPIPMLRSTLLPSLRPPAKVRVTRPSSRKGGTRLDRLRRRSET